MVILSQNNKKMNAITEVFYVLCAKFVYVFIKSYTSLTKFFKKDFLRVSLKMVRYFQYILSF